MSINPEIAERIQGVRFVPGVSGNPAGKSPGAQARATRLAEKLMADDTEAVIKAVVAAAKEATRRRPGWCSIVFGAADVVQALAVVADAMAGAVAEEVQAAGVTDGDGR